MAVLAAALCPAAHARGVKLNTVVDNQEGHWRVFTASQVPHLRKADGSFRPLLEKPDPRHPDRKRQPIPVRPAPGPPDDWVRPDFDDGAWPKQQGVYGHPDEARRATVWDPGNPAWMKCICARARFDVKNKAACPDLQVQLVYHGGVVVYLNGEELGRGHLPEGDLSLDTPADPYPRGAYVKPKFQTLEEGRRRTLELPIRPAQLKDGVNVVAVAVHRAPVAELLADPKRKAWGHAALLAARVRSGYGMTKRRAAAPHVEKVVNIHGDPKSHVQHTHTGYWRYFQRWKTARMAADDDTLEPLRRRPDRRRRETYETGKPHPVFATPAPAPGWAGPEFDDSDWFRGRGVFGQMYTRSRGSLWHPGNAGDQELVCVRGKFAVDDPAGCHDLQLAVEYIGGAVAYLNGRELARRHLPEGELTVDTPAAPYPKSAYVQPNGSLLPAVGFDDKKFGGYIRRQRVRRVVADVPPDMLRKGTNVVAIAVHRAPIRKVMIGSDVQWGHAVLLAATVRTRTGDAARSNAVPNVSRPEERQAWVHPMMVNISADAYGDRCEPLRPMRLVGARGGAYCGQVVLTCPEPIVDIEATVTDLKAEIGTIPASAVSIFYVTSNREWLQARPFRTLDPRPPKKIDVSRRHNAAMQPVCVKVRVPRDAAPGEYRGTLTVRHKMGIEGVNLIDAEPVTVPVRLTVHDWTLPEPADYRSFIDLIQSPETVALKYKVPLWSDRHFALLERSLDLLGQLGNDSFYVRLLNRTHFGESQTMVRHVRTGDGWRRDYTVFDRYLGLLVEHQGKPEVVVLYLWSRYTARGKAPRVSRLDPETGEVTEMTTPAYGTPEGEAFWKPVVEEIIERVTERGIPNHAVMLGLVGDFTGIRKDKVAFFKKIAPGVRWVWQGHGYSSSIHGVPTGYATTVWNAHAPPPPWQGHRYGWRAEPGARIGAQFARDIWRHRGLAIYRMTTPWNVIAGRRGVGRLGGDIWNVIDPGSKVGAGRHGAGGSLINRWPAFGTWGQLVVRSAFLAPGENGAIPTTPFEMLREGIQDCEARIFIENALA
ncbi:MAG: hypothetical protein R6V58_02085, partial [Planctomycetota bacterium]